MSARDAITRVIDGGRTRSRMASAPGVIAPSLARVASADSCESVTGDEGFRNRSCRASRMTASDRSLASRASVSGTARHYNGTRAMGISTANDGLRWKFVILIAWPLAKRGGADTAPTSPPSSRGYVMRNECRTGPHRCAAAAAGGAAQSVAVPVIGALGWLLAVAAAFLVPALVSWRPVTLAGVGVSALGTSIFLWQLAAARRGARGAQAGLESYLDH